MPWEVDEFTLPQLAILANEGKMPSRKRGRPASVERVDRQGEIDAGKGRAWVEGMKKRFAEMENPLEKAPACTT